MRVKLEPRRILMAQLTQHQSTARSSRPASSFRQRTRPLVPTSGCCLGVLLASHISSQKRLAYLKQALASIAAQSKPPDALILSWYADEPLASEVATALRAIRLPGVRFRCIRQPIRRSQYQHLREALTAFELEAPRDAAGAAATWLLFSDDDDLWHPQRARFARLACAHASAEPPLQSSSAASDLMRQRTRALAFGVYAYPVDEAAQELSATSQVDRALDARTVGIWLGASEVFQYAVRPALLRAFLKQESEGVLRHRFADVRFATWMRHSHKGSVVELGADELMRLDRGEAGWVTTTKGGGSKQQKPAEPNAQAWLVRNWLYFYRNTRQTSAVEWLGDLDDLNTHLEQSGKEAAKKAKKKQAASEAANGSGGSEYERASTGRQRENPGDRRAARRVLAKLGPPPGGAAAARQEEDGLTSEIGRMRHHCELTSMMCMGFRNAEALANAMIEKNDGGGGAVSTADAGAGGALQMALRAEQKELVKEALEMFGHKERRAELPTGTLEECLQ